MSKSICDTYHNLNVSKIKILSLYFVIAFAISIMLMNRSLIIGNLISLSALLYYRTAPIWRSKNIKFLIIVSIVILALMTLSIVVKTDSTKGRLLIYKLALRMCNEHPVKGIGFGKFKTTYLYHQAKYFASGKNSLSELMLADNTYYAFNDYLQIIVELGMLGVLLVLGVWVKLYNLIISFRNEQPPAVELSKSLIIAIGVAAFSTYVYQRPVYQALLIIAISIIAISNKSPNHKNTHKLIILLVTIACLIWVYVNSAIGPLSQNRKRQFQNFRALYGAGYVNEAMTEMGRAYPNFKDDAELSLLYAGSLIDRGQYQESISILDEVSTVYVGNDLFSRYGQCYEMLGINNRAEYYKLLAVNAVPNRFRTRYELFQFYLRRKDLSKAYSVARNILSLPIKVASPSTSDIKDKIKSWIKIYNQN